MELEINQGYEFFRVLMNKCHEFSEIVSSEYYYIYIMKLAQTFFRSA